MQSLRAKTAFITGAASGIGLELARLLAAEGANLALADIEAAPLEAARIELSRNREITVASFPLDIADRDSFYRVADDVIRRFGKLHIACNHAGVSYPGGPLEETPDGDLDWVIGVNIFGILNGIKALVPKIRATGEAGHVVNTASFLGLYLPPGEHRALYSATKMAVIAISQGLRDELEPSGIGVSVFCPSAVNTKTLNSARLRPERFGGPFVQPIDQTKAAELQQTKMSPARAASFLLHGIKNNMFYIITHPEQRNLWIRRNQAMEAAFDYWADFANSK